jgi:hypothetical protein
MLAAVMIPLVLSLKSVNLTEARMGHFITAMVGVDLKAEDKMGSRDQNTATKFFEKKSFVETDVWGLLTG